MKEGVRGGNKAYMECDVGGYAGSFPQALGLKDLEAIFRTVLDIEGGVIITK